MKNIKKYLFIVIVLFFSILFFNVSSCYANRLSGMINQLDIDKKVDFNKEENMNINNTINNPNENFYCITKDKGSTINATTPYKIVGCYTIDETGVHIFSGNPSGSGGWLNREWNSLDDEEKKIAKRMHYVLNYGDNDYYYGDIQVKGTPYSLRVYQKQYAISG